MNLDFLSMVFTIFQMKRVRLELILGLNDYIYFGFICEDFDNVFKFSGQELLETEYKG